MGAATQKMENSKVKIRQMLIAVLLLPVLQVGAQSAGDAEPIQLTNWSFEDVPRQAHPPRGWYDCSFSDESAVDVHPANLLSGDSAAFFGVTAKAFDGNTYLGMVVRDNETFEAVSQRLVGGPLKAGKCYTFSIYLMKSPTYISTSKTTDQPTNYTTPAKLRIYGGLNYCNRGELLAESSPVKNSEWLQYNFRFEPLRDHSFITLEAYYKTPVLFPYNGNILVDMAGKIIPVPCNEAKPQQEPEPVAAVTPKPPVTPPSTKPNPKPGPTVTPPVANKPETKPAPVKQEARFQGLRREDLRTGTVVRIEKLYFKADSTDVTETSLPVLDEIYQFLDANPDVVIEVGGHTNGLPPHEFCDRLSTERAQGIGEYLVKRGISRNRLFAKGYGKRKPVASNQTAVGRARNQRVEIKILSIG